MRQLSGARNATAWAVGLLALMGPAHALAAGMEDNPVHAWQAVSEDKLDDMRGGFDVPSVAGLHISFGIDRAVYINGDLVASAAVNIPDVARMTATQAQQLVNVVTTGNLVQNGPNNVAPPDVTAGATTAATVIQNSLNNQLINNQTIINASVNARGLLQAMNFQSSLANALNTAATGR